MEIFEISELALEPEMIFGYVIGMIVAGIVGYICIKTMLVVVRKKKFKGFAIYCLIIGIISIAGYFYMV